MTPGRYNIVCPQGSTFMKQLTYSIDDVPVNLSGYTARMQVRPSHSSSTILISMTTENGGIELGGAQGTILLDIPPTTTSTFKAQKYVYDLELVTPSSEVYRIVEGEFSVTPEVTR